ncbi:zinc finger FYVE domain-containing protein 16 [Scleropages formosus]|uniref:Zinc finger FYVE domain-containing protein n=1 Tax=Scleropages formosus TaxID=113540 RepID=A0A8C9RJQ6_SCLFO|nr:zinc finger FYVE domain-containing protein 16 [Scleropages formosus]XP_018600558.2 zinc finger FYVE domain-containing protein 16 [Scleropages formosus]XP_018600560.2 zinc finger FYVE domain-containing protein 16 [Scleropages formosus]XP_018600561.2 zinc finger FYVE domain-containing protein 16 [Scleropages formosus]XP_018600562.2 zinc finger FYVE domain-containing protein 16 [Scleropages formosus]
MDGYFRAAVCDLDKLLDDFEQNTDDVECRSATLTLPVGIVSDPSPGTDTFVPESSNPATTANINSLLYGSSVKCCGPPSYNYKDNEAKARPFTGVDLLSSVDNRTAQTPPCPGRALKPVCDLVNDTGSALLWSNRDDALKELDIIEKQLEEQLLVDFDSPVVPLPGNVSLASADSTLWKESPVEVSLLEQDTHQHLITRELPSSLGLLDISLPAVAESGSGPHVAVSTGNSDVLESLENDMDHFCNERTSEMPPSFVEEEEPSYSLRDETVSQSGQSSGDDDGKEQVSNNNADVLEAREPLHWNDDHLAQESENAIWLECSGGEMGSSPRQESSLSCLPVAVSMCGSLVASLESQKKVEPEVQENTDPVFPDSHVTETITIPEVQQCTPVVDKPVSHDNFSPADAFGEEVDRSITATDRGVTTSSHLGESQALSLEGDLGSRTLADEAVSPIAGESPRTPLPYSFVDSILSEIEKADTVVTDEELDAFLRAQRDDNPSAAPEEECTDEGFSELNADLVPSQDGLMEGECENYSGKQDRLAILDHDQNSLTGEESRDSDLSHSQDIHHRRADLIKNVSEEPTSPADSQHSHFGGARPKQLCGQPPRMLSSLETQEHGRTEARDLHSGSSVVKNNQSLTAPATLKEAPSHCDMNSSYPCEDDSEIGVGYDELSEPPPYLEVPEKDRADPLTKNIIRDAEGLGLRQPLWMPDSEAPNCMNCLQKFTFTRRRHHCRACGKVYCAVCCSRKCRLKYLEKEARVCVACYEAIRQAQAFERMMSPTGPGPNPNVPSEYCSTIPPMQQAQAAGTINSPPPTVMVPTSVLKHPGMEGFPREQRRVWFADGILPNGEFADTTWLSVGGRRTSQELSPVSLEPPVSVGKAVTPGAWSAEEHADLETVPGLRGALGGTAAALELPGGAERSPIRGPWDYSLLCSIDSLVEKAPSLLPEDEEGLPPLLLLAGEEDGGDMLVEERPAHSQVLQLLEEGGPRPLTFVLNANLLINVKLITYSRKKCWCFSSNGLQGVGQKELVFVIQCLPEEMAVPRDIFALYISTYRDAERGNFVEDLGNITFTESFLGSKEHGGFLFFRPTFQCLEGLPLPHAPYLFGVLIQKLEVPWAKVFPLRLFLRLGVEYGVYPSALVSVRYRKAVFTENGHTIMNLLADLRNYQYSLSVVEGLRIHMEMGNVYIDIPKSKFNEMLKVLNSSNEHVISMSASFSTQADSHLVCVQNEDGAYHTQANSVAGTTRKVTGASFVVFNGALKASSGFIAKSSIVEDGLMVQIPRDTMDALRQAFRDQADFQIPCGKADTGEVWEKVNVRWVDWTPPSTGTPSPVDHRSLEGAVSVRVQQETEFEAEGKTIKCTEVFYHLKSPAASFPTTLSSHSHFLVEIATAGCAALCPHLSVLKTSGINCLGLRVSVDADMVEYQAGSGGSLLPQRYMNELDSALIPVIHGGSSSIPQQPMDLEFIFYITEGLC